MSFQMLLVIPFLLLFLSPRQLVIPRTWSQVWPWQTFLFHYLHSLLWALLLFHHAVKCCLLGPSSPGRLSQGGWGQPTNWWLVQVWLLVWMHGMLLSILQSCNSIWMIQLLIFWCWEIRKGFINISYVSIFWVTTLNTYGQIVEVPQDCSSTLSSILSGSVLPSRDSPQIQVDYQPSPISITPIATQVDMLGHQSNNLDFVDQDELQGKGNIGGRVKGRAKSSAPLILKQSSQDHGLVRVSPEWTPHSIGETGLSPNQCIRGTH